MPRRPTNWRALMRATNAYPQSDVDDAVSRVNAIPLVTIRPPVLRQENIDGAAPLVRKRARGDRAPGSQSPPEQTPSVHRADRADHSFDQDA